MSPTFRRHGDAIRADLAPFEVDLLGRLRDELAGTLSEGDPSDPVVRRLFPATVTGDDDADSELRAMIHDELLRSRLEALDALVTVLARATRVRGRSRLDLDVDEANLFLGVLNDLRIALGARIGIEQLDRDGIDDADPVAAALAIIDHFAWLQEQLLAILDPAAVRHYEDGPHGTDPLD